MNKTQLKSKCKSILNSSRANEYMLKECFDFLISIFKHHPEWQAKKGIGIKNILVKNTVYGNKCFYLERLDGTFTDISYLHAINNYNNLHFIKKACREAIRPIIKKFVQTLDFSNLICAVTKEPLYLSDMHVDHYDLSFNELAEKWLSITQADLKINATKDNDLITCFATQATIEEFRKFHDENTHLRAVSQKTNLSLPRKMT